MTVQSKEVVTSLIESALDKRDVAAILEILAPGQIYHNSTAYPTARWLDRFTTTLIAAFPNLQVKVEDVVSEGDKVVVHATLSGTYKGRYRSAEAWGRDVDFHVISIMRVVNGRVEEHFGVGEHMRLLQQIGAVVS